MLTKNTLSKKQYFQHLEKLNVENNYKNPTFIFSTNTNLEKSGNVSTVEHYLYINKIKEEKANL